MIVENIRDKKLIELYQTLTKSDFKGTHKDQFVVRVIYAMQCFDLIANTRERPFDAYHTMMIAREVLRVYDERSWDDSDDWSIDKWSELMLKLLDSGLFYNDIHKMNARELKDKLKASEN